MKIMKCVVVVLLLCGIFIVPGQCAEGTSLTLEGADESRIAGGAHEALEGEIPWQVSVSGPDPNNFLCSGAIISDNFVITAASCSYWLKEEALTVGAGSVERSHPRSVHAVLRRYQHPHFNVSAPNPSFDLAILQVWPRFELSPYVVAINLPEVGRSPQPNSLATFSGWGSREWSGGLVDMLRVASLPVLDPASCQAAHAETAGATLCTDMGPNAEDPCQDDLGGPLEQEGRLLGILARGFGCHQLARRPALFASVEPHEQWVRQVTGL